VVVAVLEFDLEADAFEERRIRVEEESVDTRFETRCEIDDAPVCVRFACGDELVLPNLHAYAPSRPPAFDVENMRGE
jgi:hypothetical protein